MKTWDSAFKGLPKTKKAKGFHTSYETTLKNVKVVRAEFVKAQKAWKKAFRESKAAIEKQTLEYFKD